MFDAWLLMASGSVSMVDARDAMLAADMIRFGGANQALLWNTFARRGLGTGASSAGSADFDPTPSFESPHADNATVTFKAVGEADGHPVQLFVGRYQAATTGDRGHRPGHAARGHVQDRPRHVRVRRTRNGFGSKRFTVSLNPGQVRDMPVNMPETSPRARAERPRRATASTSTS